MAKKILGDDPFSTNASGRSKTDEGASRNAPVAKKKTKRVAPQKTEAPRAARAASTAKAPRVEPKKKAATPRPNPASVARPERSEPTANEVPSTVAPATVVPAALAMREPQAPTDAPTGSWRWWRFRQQQLARAEDAAWLARVDDMHADRFGRDPALAGRAEPIVDVVYRSVLRVSVRGLGHVPESGRAILVARRREIRSAGLAGLALSGLARLGIDLAPSTALDAALIAHAVRTEHVAHRELRPLVRPARLYTPFLGRLLRRLGGVPADVHDLARLLDDDRLALAFVDDEASGRDGTLDGKTLMCLALVIGAPIVPVVIAGAGGLASRRTALAFGTPLFPGAEFGPEGAEDEELVDRLTGELLAQLQPPPTV